MKERKKKQHDSRLLRAEKVILAAETERGHYALDVGCAGKESPSR
jgi:hypothetical protein